MIRANAEGIEARLAITKGKGQGGLFDSYSSGRLDEARGIKASDKPIWLESLLKKYESVLETEEYKTALSCVYREDIFDTIKRNVPDVFEPQQINNFLQATAMYECHQKYSDLTGLFVSALIQNSYDSGYNNFRLNTQNLKEINGLGSFISGTKERPLQIEIQGNISEFSGMYVQYSNFIVKGNTGKYCWWDAKYSSFVLNGGLGGGGNIGRIFYILFSVRLIKEH